MKRMMQSVLTFVKKEAVLSAALFLAVISVCFVPPDREYLGYIDLRTIGILFSLMAVMAGLKAIGLFDVLAERLLSRVKTLRATVLILWALCFFGSMLITNDVALITFVPFTMILLDMMGAEMKQKRLIPIVAMQTVAANLGSMLTPVGNPQNLYLYGKAGMGLGRFILLMLPYTLVSFAMLVGWTMLLCRGNHEELAVVFGEKKQITSKSKLVSYLGLFGICLLAVARVLPFWIPLAVIVVYLLIFDRKMFGRVDYALLLTFAGFFVFIGNMGRIEPFRVMLEHMMIGHEVLTAVLSSQLISNVPAALLLSGFTTRYEALIVGTNLGGLGTLIASMASLISFKYISREDKKRRLPYLLHFTAANLVFLAVLWVLRCLIFR